MQTHPLRVMAAAFLAALLLLTVSARMAGASQMGDIAPTRYRLAATVYEMPSRIVLRGCLPSEDTLARLRLVKYEPGRVAVYRCIAP